MSTIVKKHFGWVDENGKAIFDDLPAFKQELLSLKGKRVVFTVKRHFKNRTYRQNDYFHGVICVKFAGAMHGTPDEAKEALKAHFLSTPLDNGLLRIKSTAELNTAEFEEFCSRCRQLASEFYDLYIPKPNECEY